MEPVFRSYSRLAVAALCKEVELSPKPGLVDAFDSGSHKDMDLHLLIKSALAFEDGFCEYLATGYQHTGSPKELLAKIRLVGMTLETQMFLVTKGINTHKGANFSFGVFLTALGAFLKKNSWTAFQTLSPKEFEDLIAYLKEMTQGLAERDFSDSAEKNVDQLSYGETLFLQYGFRGIRGEAEAGYPSIVALALPKFFALSATTRSKDAVYLELLFWLMTVTEDSNLIARGGITALSYAKTVAEDFLRTGGTSHPNYPETLAALNQSFVERNISPGGSADLLSLTIFLSTIVDPPQ